MAPDMPYGYSDLEPVMSHDSLWFHFSRQQHNCFEPMLDRIRGTELDQMDLRTLIWTVAQAPGRRAVYQYASGLWNHDMFWRSMRPGGGGRPFGTVAQHIRLAYGSYERFATEFQERALMLYGNGWLWVTWHASKVGLLTTRNSRPPFLDGHRVLLALDLWEHAYYLDHQNRRSNYVAGFLENLVNWNFANANLDQQLRLPG